MLTGKAFPLSTFSLILGRPSVAGDEGAVMGQVSLLTASENSECLVPC